MNNDKQRLGWVVYETMGDIYDYLTDLPHEELIAQGFQLMARKNSLNEEYVCYLKPYDDHGLIHDNYPPDIVRDAIENPPGHMIPLGRNRNHPEVQAFIKKHQSIVKAFNGGVLPKPTPERIAYDEKQRRIKSAFKQIEDFHDFHYFGAGTYLRVVCKNLGNTERLADFLKVMHDYRVDIWKFETEEDKHCYRFNNEAHQWELYR